MKLEVLLSCMNQSDMSLAEKSKISGNVLIINQADHEYFECKKEEKRSLRMITTTERGLSRSRNMAIANSIGDICLLCDDDEIFTENYEQIILTAFKELPDADVITFDIENKFTALKPIRKRLHFLDTLKIASFQIAFRKSSIMEQGLLFDPFMGAGSGNGAQEENKFLFDCLKKGLKIYYEPHTIAALYPTASTWFFGFDQTFFYQRGATTRYMMGRFLSLLYGIYYVVRKHDMYRSTLSMRQAMKALLKGIWENPIKIQKQIYRETDNG